VTSCRSKLYQTLSPCPSHRHLPRRRLGPGVASPLHRGAYYIVFAKAHPLTLAITSSYQDTDTSCNLAVNSLNRQRYQTPSPCPSHRRLTRRRLGPGSPALRKEVLDTYFSAKANPLITTGPHHEPHTLQKLPHSLKRYRKTPNPFHAADREEGSDQARQLSAKRCLIHTFRQGKSIDYNAPSR